MGNSCLPDNNLEIFGKYYKKKQLNIKYIR